MSTQWQSQGLQNNGAAPNLALWLQDPGSFMQRLRHSGVADARIDIMCERRQLPLREEILRLRLPARRYVLVREVLIHSARGRWMFARTVLPETTLSGQERKLARLQNHSLGSYLFKQKSMTRSHFEWTTLETESLWWRKIQNYLADVQAKIWARRSVFHVRNKPLLLTEIFLPDMAALKYVAQKY
jgi:chorismate--pyruvate lyase